MSSTITTYHLPWSKLEEAVKRRVIVYYVHDVDAATARSIRERELHNVGVTRDASVFVPADAELCDEVVVMPEVPAHYRARIEEAYGKKVARTIAEPAVEQLISGAERRDTTSDAPTQEPTRVAPPEEYAPPPPPIPDGPATFDQLNMLTRKEMREYAEKMKIDVGRPKNRNDLISRIMKGLENIAA